VKTGQSVVVRINDRGPFHSNRIIDLSYAAAARIGVASAGSGLVDVERVIPGVEVGEVRVAAATVPPPPPAAAVQTALVAREGAEIWLQLGAFSSLDGAENFREHVARELPWILEPIAIASREGVHRVRIGPYRNNEEATAVGDKVRSSLGVAPLVTNR
jgi:rare lipoprotein A